MTSIVSTFGELNARGEGALVAFLTGGDPTPNEFLENVTSLVEGGADIIEIGIPFSDPIADGPVLQGSSQRALKAGVTPKTVLSLAKEVRSSHDVPVVLLTYCNPILAMGTERFFKLAGESGVSGVVIPDCPIQENFQFKELAAKHNIDRILLAAPNTPAVRMKQILHETSGFLYLVSLYGVTGQRDTVGPAISQTLRTIREGNHKSKPVCVGFGISTPDHVRALLSLGADGVIVGSALVQIIRDQLEQPEEARTNLKRKVSALKEATRHS